MMAGRGPAPKADRQNKYDVPARGEYQATPGVGWQHGETPRCPVRSRAAQETWSTWMGSWFAAHWTPQDLPNLRLVVKLWAKCDTGKAIGSERTELRQLMDSYGITPKGQQDRRWTPPKADQHPQPEPSETPGRLYGHLRAVGDD